MIVTGKGSAAVPDESPWTWATSTQRPPASRSHVVRLGVCGSSNQKLGQPARSKRGNFEVAVGHPTARRQDLNREQRHPVNALRADLGPRDDEHVRLQHGVVGDGHVGGRVKDSQVLRASLLQDADQIAAHPLVERFGRRRHDHCAIDELMAVPVVRQRVALLTGPPSLIETQCHGFHGAPFPPWRPPSRGQGTPSRAHGIPVDDTPRLGRLWTAAERGADLRRCGGTGRPPRRRRRSPAEASTPARHP